MFSPPSSSSSSLFFPRESRNLFFLATIFLPPKTPSSSFSYLLPRHVAWRKHLIWFHHFSLLAFTIFTPPYSPSNSLHLTISFPQAATKIKLFYSSRFATHKLWKEVNTLIFKTYCKKQFEWFDMEAVPLKRRHKLLGSWINLPLNCISILYSIHVHNIYMEVCVEMFGVLIFYMFFVCRKLKACLTITKNFLLEQKFKLFGARMGSGE